LERNRIPTIAKRPIARKNGYKAKMFFAGSPDRNSTMILPEFTAGGSVEPSNP
jgi:hypothetical protein